MDKLMKLFILMPEAKNTGKLVLAILFYAYVPSIVAGIVSTFLALTLILAPTAMVVSSALGLYAVLGILLSIMKYNGKELNQFINIA